MTANSPKEKALELYSSARFLLSLPGAPLGENKDHVAKQFCLWNVYEVIEAIDWHEFEIPNEQFVYWQEVKKELELL